MRILYTPSLLFLLALGCAKTPLINEQDFHSNYYQQIVQSTLKNYIKKRLNKIEHPPTSTLIHLHKSNTSLMHLNNACDQCHILKKGELIWLDKNIEGYKIHRTEPINDLTVTIIVSDLFTNNDPADSSELRIHYHVHSKFISYPNYFIDVYTINEGKATLQKTLPLVIY